MVSDVECVAVQQFNLLYCTLLTVANCYFHSVAVIMSA